MIIDYPDIDLDFSNVRASGMRIHNQELTDAYTQTNPLGISWSINQVAENLINPYNEPVLSLILALARKYKLKWPRSELKLMANDFTQCLKQDSDLNLKDYLSYLEEYVSSCSENDGFLPYSKIDFKGDDNETT